MISLHNAASSLQAIHSLAQFQRTTRSSMEALSTGKRINAASDDAAGLSTSVKLTTQLSSSAIAQRNIQEAKALLSMRESYLNTLHEIGSEVRDIWLRAGDPALGVKERQALDKQKQQLSNMIWQIHGDTAGRYQSDDRFGGVRIGFDKKVTSATRFDLQIGAGQSDTFSMELKSVYNAALQFTLEGVDKSVAPKDYLRSVQIRRLDDALEHIDSVRAEGGAYLNRLEYAHSNLMQQVDSVTQAKRRINDADFASNVAILTAYQVKQQAAASVLAQGSVSKDIALQLLGGARNG